MDTVTETVLDISEIPDVPDIPIIPQCPPVYTLSLLAAGDNLIHITMINSALENGVYNFDPVLLK